MTEITKIRNHISKLVTLLVETEKRELYSDDLNDVRASANKIERLSLAISNEAEKIDKLVWEKIEK